MFFNVTLRWYDTGRHENLLLSRKDSNIYTTKKWFKPKSMENVCVMLWCSFSVHGLSCNAHFTTLFTVCFLSFYPCVYIPERRCSSRLIILFSWDNTEMISHNIPHSSLSLPSWLSGLLALNMSACGESSQILKITSAERR